MERTVNVWSKAYAPTVDTDHFSIQVDQECWEEMIREERGTRVFLRIQNPGSFGDWIAPMGQPVPAAEVQETPNPNIYIPLWMCDAAHLDGIGEPLQVTFLTEDAFPEATRLVFQVVDSAFYNSDVKEELEKALTAIGVVRKGTSLQIPIEALGGYQVEVFVAETEPAEIVLCQGEEVAVEFLEPVDQVVPPPPARPPTPIPEMNPIIIPSPHTIAPYERHLPYAPTNTNDETKFEGEGRVLGSDPSIAPPSWRQGLPIPRQRPQQGLNAKKIQ